MTSSPLPKNEFSGREAELSRILSIADPASSPNSSNILITGPTGIGKSELLRQVYNKVFWESRDIVPFIYQFQSALLTPEDFARDYTNRFIRQVIAFDARTPSISEDHWLSTKGLFKETFSETAGIIQGLMPELDRAISSGTPAQAVMAALSFPSAVADRTGKRLLVLLDDFHLASKILLSEGHCAESLFGTQLSNTLCPHVITAHGGSTIELMFSDDALRGKTQRHAMAPLVEDISFRMLCTLVSNTGTVIRKECRQLMHLFGGNPLFIRNIASSLLHSNRREIAAGDLLEHYALEVTEGETAAVLSAVLRSSINETRIQSVAIEIMARHLDTSGGQVGLWEQGESLGFEPDHVRSAVAGLEAAGFVKEGILGRDGIETLLRDFITSLYLMRIRGKSVNTVRKAIIRRHKGAISHKESIVRMTIPKESGSEIIAVRALEQICASTGAGHEICEKLQLALIEACINAMEHSGGYQQEISLAFHVKDGAIEITVESDGRFFDPDTALREEAEPSAAKGARRGWGLKLIRGIVDEVRTERAGDATRLVLVKKINHSEVVQ